MSIDFVPGDTVQVPEIPYADEVTASRRRPSSS